MRACVFASGSSGNCMLLSEGETHILIDAGISMRRLEASLRQAGLKIGDICGVLITHEHSDHVSGLKMLLKYYDLQLYAPHTVAARLCGFLPEAEEQMHLIRVGALFEIGALRIRAFHTPHDTDESVGYRVEGESVFALATDMGTVTEEVLHGLSGAEAVLIEANHDRDLLLNGSYPLHLKRRILSERGHLSNADCAVLAKKLADTGTRTVILGHLSKENNRPELALRESEKLLEGSGVQLCCAPAYGFLSLEIGGEGSCWA